MSTAYLNLCKAHRQEPNRSHFDPQNCDYCKLAKVNHELVEALVKASQDLLAGHVVDAILHERKHPRSPPLPEPASLELIRRVLARAKEVPGI